MSPSLFLILSCIVLLHHTVTSSSGTCRYFIQDLEPVIEISSSAEVGDTLAILTIEERHVRRKRRGLEESDLLLDTVTPYFKLSFLESSWKLNVESCLPTGLNEILTFTIGETGEECDPTTSLITVLPTRPVVSVPESVVVDVEICGNGVAVDIFAIEFNVSYTCVSFECSVTSTSSQLQISIEEDYMVRTFTDDINFGHAYSLHVICRDADDAKTINKTDEATVEVIFHRNCIPVITTLTPIIGNTSDVLTLQGGENTAEGFFSNPANIAIVSSATVFSTVAVGILIMSYKGASGKKKSSVGNTGLRDLVTT